MLNSLVQKYWLLLPLQREAQDPCVCHLDLQVLSSDISASGTTQLTRAQRNRGFQKSYSAAAHDMFKQHWAPSKEYQKWLSVNEVLFPSCSSREKVSVSAFLIPQSSICVGAEAKHQPSIEEDGKQFESPWIQKNIFFINNYSY